MAQSCMVDYMQKGFLWIRDNYSNNICHHYRLPRMRGSHSQAFDLWVISIWFPSDPMFMDGHKYGTKYRDHCDPILIDGQCTTSPCETHHEETMWVSSVNKTQVCIDEEHHYLNVNWPTDLPIGDLGKYDFFSDDLISQTFKGSCRATFCGLWRLVLDSGEWVAFKSRLGYFTDLINKYEKCNKTRQEVIISRQTSIDLKAKSVYTKLRQHRCEETRERILAGEPISRIDLQLFGPTVPGKGSVYRYNLGKIEVGSADYIFLDLFDKINRTTGAIGLTATKTAYIWDSWIYSTTRIRDGPNGIFIRDFDIIHPDVTYETEVSKQNKELFLTLDNFTHPLLSSLSAKVQSLEVTYLTHDHSHSLDQVIDSHILFIFR